MIGRGEGNSDALVSREMYRVGDMMVYFHRQRSRVISGQVSIRAPECDLRSGEHKRGEKALYGGNPSRY